MADLKRNENYLRLLAQVKPRVRKQLVATAPNDVLKTVANCCFNMLKGTVPLTPMEMTKLKKHKKIMRMMAKKRVSMRKKRKALMTGGLFLPALLSPILSSLVGSVIKKIRKRK